MSAVAAELAVLAALAAAQRGCARSGLEAALAGAGVGEEERRRTLDGLCRQGLVASRGALLELSALGARRLLEIHAEIEAALDPSPPQPGLEDCPSLPWLTAVQTQWIDAVSINYAVDPGALRPLLPDPLEPELHRGLAWVQVLVSSLREMRPRGAPALFGVNFYQASYRAAVRLRRTDGSWRRGGYFVRSETNHEVMRAVGNALVEFKFHDFGAAEMVMLREGERLTVGIDSQPERPGGRLVGVFDTRPSSRPPESSAWPSLADLQEPLVECYDALGVDRPGGWLYVLTIDRGPWNARFVRPEHLYCEWAEEGPLAGACRLDSVLHVRECPYRWRPLRRERLG